MGTLWRERIGEIHDHQPESTRVGNPGGGTDLRLRRFQPQQNQPIQSDPGFHRIRREEETAGRRYPGHQSRIRIRTELPVGVVFVPPFVVTAVLTAVVTGLKVLCFGNKRQR